VFQQKPPFESGARLRDFILHPRCARHDMAWERYGIPLSSSRVRERDDDDAMVLGLITSTDSEQYVC
jgi:hypothetical protein